jgi:uncharacterized membrane protein
MRGNQFIQSLARMKYKLALGSLLVAASILSVVIQRVHTWVNGENSYANLVFNLALAWIPFAAAVLAYLASRRRITFYLIMPVCTLVWLIFFPNAPYLLTDFQHLAFTNGSAPLWFDVILMIWFAWTGLLLGIASLYLMHEIVAKTFNQLVGWVFAISVTVLSSFGVYLGRFLRWNSWDLLYDPIPIARDMVAIVRHPISNLPTYVFTILFTLLFLFIYVTIHLFGGIHQERRQK